ncbi:hypothetical protein HYH03_014478 [Edaphochlamys debaryana]|uniref:Uncharacterized protein n=1 Tax=Edaphochlamys debaryana TaxID=47281 RepID=A0A835XNP2_9CHLO|nr:hypothetical protein HYH03_014478 [Edaphochlamys debaryana]|eukprot:KAG2486884.1 hypothetical protein HYH03_014478 [Edaphochlamys debaryana]
MRGVVSPGLILAVALQGKDGFNVFAECKQLVDSETGVVIPSTIKCHFVQLRVLNKWIKKVKSVQSMSNLAAMADGAADDGPVDPEVANQVTLEAQQRTHGLAVPHPEEEYYTIAPMVEGRIINGAEQE